MKQVTTAFIFFLFIGVTASAQSGYTSYMTKDGLKISTKWSKAKDAQGTKKPALLIGIQNTNEYSVVYRYTINLFYEGMLRESGQMEEICIDGLKSRIGRLNGVYFIPEKFTPEQLKSTDFNFEIDDVEVERVDNCDLGVPEE